MAAEGLIKLAGAVVAATGLSLRAPGALRVGVCPGLPENTLQHTYINGGIETAIGLALVAPKTRKLAVAGLVAYGAYLGANIARHR